MKRVLLLVTALCLLLLAACAGEAGDPNVYDVEYAGKTYTVDYNQSTITFGGHVCQFQVTGNGNSMRFEVTYPDGSSYWMQWSGNAGGGGFSDDYDPNRYVSGDTLWSVLEQERPGARNNSGHWFIGLILAGLGVLEIAFPQVSWYLSHGWRYKNAEPSDLALGLGRAGGAILVLVGVICFFA